MEGTVEEIKGDLLLKSQDNHWKKAGIHRPGEILGLLEIFF